MKTNMNLVPNRNAEKGAALSCITRLGNVLWYLEPLGGRG